MGKLFLISELCEHAENDEAKKNIRNLADLCLLKPEEVTKNNYINNDIYTLWFEQSMFRAYAMVTSSLLIFL